MAVHKSTLSTRWFMLLFACMVMIGQYYTYDNPSALHVQLDYYFTSNGTTGSTLSEASFESFFNQMYSFYSLPNMFLPLFGGVLIDKVGARIMLIVLISLVTAGQTLTALGISLRSPVVSLAGRFLFGLGGETLSAAMSTVLAQWFKGKELAFAMGINLSISRLGSVVNDNLSPFLSSNTGLGLTGTFFFGVIVLCVSVFCAIVMFFLDRSAEIKLRHDNALISEQLLANGEASSPHADEDEEPKRVTIKETLVGLVKDIGSYSLGFWLITLSCVVIYGAIIPFNSISQTFLIEKFFCGPIGECCATVGDNSCPNFDTQTSNAGAAISIPFTISAVSAPILGGLIDRFGFRAVLIFCSSAVIIFVHSYFFLMPANDVTAMYIPLVLQGVAYSVYSAALWPSVAYVVDDRLIGTAYGITTAVQNIGLFVFPMIIAALFNDLGSYTKVEPFFALLGIIGLFIAIALNVWDMRHGGYLNSKDNTLKELAPVKESENPLIHGAAAGELVNAA